MSQCGIFRVDSRGYRLSRNIKFFEEELKRQRKTGVSEELLEAGVQDLEQKKEKYNQIKKEAKLLK